MEAQRSDRTGERVRVAQANGEFQGMMLLIAIVLFMLPLIALFTS